MNKYDGINKPEVNLHRNEIYPHNYSESDGNSWRCGERLETVSDETNPHALQGDNLSRYRLNECDFQSGSNMRGHSIKPYAYSANGSADGLCENERFDGSIGDSKRKKRGFFKSLLLRAIACALLLAFVFLPRFMPYKGSDKVTETVKTIVMTDIIGNKAVGEGKIVEIIRSLIDKFGGSES